MSNVISLLDRLSSTMPLTGGSLAELHRLKSNLSLVHRELLDVLSQLAQADDALSPASPEPKASTAETSQTPSPMRGRS